MDECLFIPLNEREIVIDNIKKDYRIKSPNEFFYIDDSYFYVGKVEKNKFHLKRI